MEENIGDTGVIVAGGGSVGGNIISEQDILSGKVNYLNGVASMSVGASQVVGSVSPIFTTPGRYKIVLISESASNDTSQDKTISVSLKRNGAIAGTQILFGATNPLDGGDIFCSGVSTNSGETLDTPTQIHFIARDTNQEITANKVIKILDITQADIDSGNNKLVFKASVPLLVSWPIPFLSVSAWSFSGERFQLTVAFSSPYFSRLISFVLIIEFFIL